MGKKMKEREFNDLLIPIILVLAVLPFVVRLISYDTGLSDYTWYSDFDIAHDFFTYYKSYSLLLIAIVSFIILIPYALLKRNRLKDMRPFVLLGIYSLLAIISTMFSVNMKSSLRGGFEHFESIFVLLGYFIILIYTYQIDKKEEDYKSIIKAFLVSLIILCFIGILQMFGKDLFTYSWFQKLIIPQSDWKDYVGNIKSYISSNAVALTLFNPNFAAVYLAMGIPFLITLILPVNGTNGQKSSAPITKVERIIITVVIIMLTILLFKTYSRTGLLSLAVSLLILVLFHRELLKSRWKQCAILVICGLILFTGIDFMNHFRFIKKINGTIQSFYDDQNTTSLDEILTKEQGVYIDMKGEGITVTLTRTNDKATLSFVNANGEDITAYYDSTTKHLKQKQFEDLTFDIKRIDEKDYIFCKINEIIWRFGKDEKDGYVYINDFGKGVPLTKVEHIGVKGVEDIGSGRGYIWSRSIPLLKDTLFIGTGPDTFLYSFPQSDYVGKANNCKTPYTLIEKAHSMYLMTGLQTGIISLIALIAFYLLYMIRSIRIYKKIALSGLKERMGFGCFLATLSFVISGFFTDSSIQTTPVFIILLGLGMDINFQLEKSVTK